MSAKTAATTSHPGGFFISALVDEAWRIFRNSWTTLLMYFFLVGVLMVVPGLILSSLVKGTFLAPIILLGMMLWNIVLGMGFMNVILKVTRDEDVAMADLWEKKHLVVKYFLGVLLYILIVFGGFILLVVPGIIWSIKYMFIPYLIIDKGMGPMEAMRTSAKMTDGIKWDIFGASYVFGIIAQLGLLALIVGIFVTIPVAMIGQYLIYQRALTRLE